MRDSRARAHHRRTLQGVAILIGVAACVAVIAIATGDGSPSWNRAVAFSGSVCLAASLAGWIVARWPRRSPAMRLAGGLAGLCVRIMPPLAALAWLRVADEGWRGSGADRLLLAFYLSLLATDIILNIMEMERSGGRRGGNAAN